MKQSSSLDFLSSSLVKILRPFCWRNALDSGHRHRTSVVGSSPSSPSSERANSNFELLCARSACHPAPPEWLWRLARAAVSAGRPAAPRQEKLQSLPPTRSLREIERCASLWSCAPELQEKQQSCTVLDALLAPRRAIALCRTITESANDLRLFCPAFLLALHMTSSGGDETTTTKVRIRRARGLASTRDSAEHDRLNSLLNTRCLNSLIHRA